MTKELIKIEASKIGDQEVNAVDGRELHAWLGVETPFNKWVKRKVVDSPYFEENQDYCILDRIVQNSVGRPSTEYLLKIDCAKKVSMAENSDRGNEARDYFIECERKLKEQQPILPSYQEALRQLADSLDREENLKIENRQKEEKLIEYQPKVDAFNQFLDAEGLCSMEVAAKAIGWGRNKLIARLRNDGILTRENVPFQKFMRDGRFRVKFVKILFGVKQQTMLTAKGLYWLFENYKVVSPYSGLF